MIHQPNWETVRKRYMDFWNHTLSGRAILNMRAPAPVDEPPMLSEPLPVNDLHDRWENAELILHNALYDYGRTRYYAEGYPTRVVNFGPGNLAAMVGGTYKLAQDTIWFDNGPVIDDYARDLDKIRLNPDSDAYRVVFDMTRRFAGESRGRYITAITSLGTATDIAVSLRGNENLLYDIYDEPEGLLALTERLDDLWIEVYGRLYDLLQQYQTGCDSWHNIYCEKRYFPVQCDFAAMLSPEQFDRFVMPSLRRCCDALDYGDFHLDGPDCIRHVPSLLSIPNLDAIQWVAGAGAAPDSDPCWYGMYRQIQDAGKNLILLGLDADGACKLLDELDQTKLLLNVGCADEREAERVLRFAEDHA